MSVVVSQQGPLCRRCGQRTVIYQHERITAKMLRQPYYYREWYKCINDDCKTTLIMPEEHRVYAGAQESKPEPARLPFIDDTDYDTSKPPWE